MRAKNLVEFELSINIEINVIKAVAILEKLEKRPDIHWILRNIEILRELASMSPAEEFMARVDNRVINNIPLSSGEAKQLFRYLESLGLVDRNYELTSLGEEAIKTGEVFVPERGLYKFYYVDDAIFGPRIFYYDRVKPVDEKDLLDSFKIYEDFEGIDHKTAVRQGDNYFRSRIKIKFIRKSTEEPKVLVESGIEGKLIVSHKNGKTIAKLSANVESISIEHEEEININLDENLKSWIPGWDPSIQAGIITYEEVRQDEQAFRTFMKTYRFSEVCLWTNSGKYWVKYPNGETKELCAWEGYAKVPLVPTTIKDLNLWLMDLIIRELKNKQIYPTEEYIKNLVERLLVPINEKISKKFGRYSYNVNFLKSKLRDMRDELYWRIMATMDLYPS